MGEGKRGRGGGDELRNCVVPTRTTMFLNFEVIVVVMVVVIGWVEVGWGGVIGGGWRGVELRN